MDWNNLNFKAKDVILIISFVLTMGGFYFGIKYDNSQLSTDIQHLRDDVTIIKQDNKESNKETVLWRKSTENNINTNTTNLKLMDMRLSNLENNLIR